MTLTIRFDGTWSSFRLANSAPLSVTDSAIAPWARRICVARHPKLIIVPKCLEQEQNREEHNAGRMKPKASDHNASFQSHEERKFQEDSCEVKQSVQFSILPGGKMVTTLNMHSSPSRVCCHWLGAMPAQHVKASERAHEDTSPAKIDVTSTSPVGDISVVTLIRTDTTLDHSQKAEKVCAVPGSKLDANKLCALA